MKAKTAKPTEPVVDEALTQAQAEIDVWKTKYMRALADYQNLERRGREEKEEVRRYAAEIILGRLLPVVDTFRKVGEHVDDMGFTLALKELTAVLDEFGVKHIAVIGREFNPHEMECIEVAEGPDNQVIAELLPGYMFHDKVLRVAQVKVGKSNQ